MTHVRFHDIWKTYAGGGRALESVHLDIAAGERIALVGPSGSGKSTLLRIVAGLESVSRGKLFFDDKDVTKVDPSDRSVAMVFQRDALWSHRTARENIFFGLEEETWRHAFRRWFSGNRGSKEKGPRDRHASEIVEMLEIGRLLERYPRELSGGERQRVSLAHALIRKPRLLLFDEPLTYLDASLRSSLREAMARLQSASGVTSILVTHDPTEALAFGQRVAVLVGGKIRQFATPREIYEKPANSTVAALSSETPVGLLRGAWNEDSGQLYFVSSAGRFPVSSNFPPPVVTHRAVVLGIRAEHLRAGRKARDVSHDVSSTLSFVAVAEWVEFRGSQSLVTLNAGGGRLHAWIQNDEKIELGERIPLSVESRHLMFFDPESGDLLECP